MSGILPPYKPCQVYDAGGDVSKRWYLYYYYQDPTSNKYERFKEYFDINLIKTFNERTAYAKEAVKFIDDRLKEGYNPFQEKEMMASLQYIGESSQRKDRLHGEIILAIANAPEDEKQDLAAMVLNTVNSLLGIEIPIPKEIRGAMIPKDAPLLLPTLSDNVDELKKSMTGNTRETYSLMLGRFKKFLEATGNEKMLLEDFNLEIAQQAQSYLLEDMQLARKTVNATTSHWGLLFEPIVISKRAPVNYFRQLKPYRKSEYRGRAVKGIKEDTDFIPLTPDELDRVIKHYIKIGAKPFLRFLGLIYYAWVRPVEICRLKVGDIDLKNRSIRFLKEDTKDFEYAHVQIVEPLYELLKGMDLHKYPTNYYLFSEGFFPGSVQLNAYRDCTVKWWNVHVVDTLQIKKKMYGLKASGNIDYLLRNKGKLDMKWVQMQNRHGSLDVTEVYIKRLGVYFVETGKFSFRSFT